MKPKYATKEWYAKHKIRKQPWYQVWVLIPLFTLFYSSWLENWDAGESDVVLKVCSWRSARVCSKYGQVRWMQPCFWIFQ